jgi:ketosteroid isomerase-like protein
MSEDNRALLRSIFDQLAVGNGRPLVDAMADDCRWVFPGNWSWAGTWAPKREIVGSLLRPLMAQFRSYRSEADLILADGDRVMVQARGCATTRRGDEYHQTYCMIYTVVGGRLTEIVEHCDTALVERVLEPVRRPPSG